MGDMIRKFQGWFAAALAGVTLAVLIPAQAWAADNGTAQLVVEAARKSRRGGFGVVGIICCLGVVAIAVIAFIVISRNRKRR
ncbi:hypothetical protein AB0G04_03145 [Actinoplanes sp. NPDC023801]|uniref:hypothetical protein n=1 Tax=Actinoplanes sp. NPDC023801 TaxID=3154595 RepID=UPI00340CFF41